MMLKNILMIFLLSKSSFAVNSSEVHADSGLKKPSLCTQTVQKIALALSAKAVVTELPSGDTDMSGVYRYSISTGKFSSNKEIIYSVEMLALGKDCFVGDLHAVIPSKNPNATEAQKTKLAQACYGRDASAQACFDLSKMYKQENNSSAATKFKNRACTLGLAKACSGGQEAEHESSTNTANPAQ